MRRTGPAAAGGAPADDREQRLALGEAAREPRELGGVAEGLEIERGGAHLGVVVPGGQQVVARDVALVAERDERAHAQPELASQVHEDDADTTGLAGHREAAGRRDRVVEGGVQPDLGVVDEQTEAVGADQPDAPCAGGHRQLALEPGALGTQLAESRRHDDGGPDTGGGRGVEQHVVRRPWPGTQTTTRST